MMRGPVWGGPQAAGKRHSQPFCTALPTGGFWAKLREAPRFARYSNSRARPRSRGDPQYRRAACGKGARVPPKMQPSGEHAAEERPLKEDWEAITDDSGRTYFWNTQTDEVTWNRLEASAPRDYTGPSLGGQGEPCTACGNTVFLAERRVAGSAPYHADCFRCKICAKKLLTDWEADPEGALFCQVHFHQELMAKGMPR